MNEIVILLGMMFLLSIVLLVLTLALGSKSHHKSQISSQTHAGKEEISKIKKQITEEEEW
jgi:hypothetical protein